jgi:glycosyltransferase involved in cell wall biosynthesis
MNATFETDPFPNKPKILFIGHGSSTHTHAWIDLLARAELNVRLFGLPTGIPPNDWPVRTYVTLPVEQMPIGLNTNSRRSLHPSMKELKSIKLKLGRITIRQLHNLIKLPLMVWKEAIIYLGSLLRGTKLNLNPVIYGLIQLTRPGAKSPEAWLADVIREWQPDIIHTLGLDPASFFYDKVRDRYHLAGSGKWVLQLRGGSDLTLSRFDPELLPQITKVLQACDQLISDNHVNFQYALEMGVKRDKFASIAPIPGTGGIDVERLAGNWKGNPSERRIILWPKAYDCEWSVALPVLEAIRIAWDHIEPCEIHMFVMVTQAARQWYNTLPLNIRQNCRVYGRVPRNEILDLMPQARVMLAPSLVDGVPNSLYEAMAAGAFPIVSPLATLLPIVQDEQNGLFARNLYPEEIAKALVRAMNDDELVDNSARLNLELVEKLANRSNLRSRVLAYYEKLVNG